MPFVVITALHKDVAMWTQCDMLAFLKHIPPVPLLLSLLAYRISKTSQNDNDDSCESNPLWGCVVLAILLHIFAQEAVVEGYRVPSDNIRHHL